MSLVGDKTKVRHGLESILRETEADEIMVNGQIFDHRGASAFFRFSDAGERGAVGVTHTSARWTSRHRAIALLINRQQIDARQDMYNRIAEAKEQDQHNHWRSAPDAELWAAEAFA